jgi:hypothetical protein
VAVLLQHLREPVPPLREINPAVPQAVATLIQRMLSKSPAARPQTYDELIGQLDRVGTEIRAPRSKAQAARRPPEPGPPETRSFTSRLLGYGIAAVVLAALIGLAWTWTPREPVLNAVAPPPTLASAAEPAQALAPAEMRVVRTAHEITESGLFRVHGDVRNAGATTATAVTARVVLVRTEDGESLDTQEVLVAPSRLPAGEQGSFEALFPNPARKINVLLELHWESLPEPSLPSLPPPRR